MAKTLPPLTGSRLVFLSLSVAVINLLKYLYFVKKKRASCPYTFLKVIYL